MRLVTWNCSSGRRQEKLDLATRFGADVALLQELSRPTTVVPGLYWYGDNPQKGIALMAAPEYSMVPLGPNPAICSTILPFRINGLVEMNLLAVWAHRRPTYVAAIDAALTAYADVLRIGPTIVMGDFNASAVFDGPKTQNGFRHLAQRLQEEFGLKSAYHSFTGEAYGAERSTTHYFRWSQQEPFHIDYCFVPEDWQVTSADIGSFDEYAEISDHRPVVVDVAP